MLPWTTQMETALLQNPAIMNGQVRKQLHDCVDAGRLGAGADGEVRRYAKRCGVLYAVKFYKEKKEYTTERNILLMFKELRGPLPVVNVIATDHPSLPPSNGKAYRLVMEYCDIGDLSQYFEAATNHGKLLLYEDIIWKIFRQLGEAIAFLHVGYGTPFYNSRRWQTIVHRDIKPKNILIRKTNCQAFPYRAILTDFGRAHFFDPQNLRGSRGTPSYAPPEYPRAGPEGDIWSIGACVHYLATGKPPIAESAEYPRKKNMTWDDWYAIPRVVYGLESAYSRDLEFGMRTALDFDHSTRITASQLVEILWPPEAEVESDYD